MFVDCANLDVVDYLRSGALVVGFLAVLVADRKKRSEGAVWWKADVITCGVFGAVNFLAPKYMLEYVTTAKVDIVHEAILRVTGAWMLGAALTYRHFSNERTTYTAWLLSRTVVYAAWLQLQIYVQTQYAGQAVHMKDQNVTFSMLAIALLLVGSLVHLVQRGTFGSVRRAWTTSDPMTLHLLIHILFLLPMMLGLLMFPDFVLNKVVVLKDFKPDIVHLVAYRMMGLVLFSNWLFALMALGFSEERDRKVVFAGFLWAVLFTTPWSLVYVFSHQMVSPTGYAIQWAYGAIPLINAMVACGCLPSPKQLLQKKRV